MNFVDQWSVIDFSTYWGWEICFKLFFPSELRNCLSVIGHCIGLSCAIVWIVLINAGYAI